jgi:uncharacterized membrane protein (DUF373 family)
MAGAILLGVGPTVLLLIALIKNRSEQLDLGQLGSMSQLGFGLILVALGVVYYFVAGRPKEAVSNIAPAEEV